MPRDRLISGNYGQANAARESLKQIPLPDRSGALPTPDLGQAPPPEEELDPIAQAVLAAQGAAPPADYLNQRSSRPNEPVQAGLSLGPGGGPSILPNFNRSRVADDFDQIGQITGSPHMALLARRARMRTTQAEKITKRRFGPGRQAKDHVGLIPAQTVGKGRRVPGGQRKSTAVERGIGPGIRPRKTEDQGIQGQDGQPNRTGPKDGPQ
jgi:hypothetical protein